MKTYAHVLARVFGAPLLIEPRKAEIIARAVMERIAIGASIEFAPVRASVDAADRERLARKPYDVTADGVALIDVSGTLVHKSMTASPPSGFSTYAEIEAHLMDAATDPAIRAIALDVDSPGGEASDSAFALADNVRAAASIKPVWAIADEMMASAAYLVSSGASRIVMPPTGMVGSVGVIAMHVDKSAFNEKQGVKVTIVRAGARKADGNPHEPLSEAALAQMQTAVAGLYDRFVAAVSANRRLAAARVRGTEAAVFETGAEAMSAGLVDAVQTPIAALRALTASLSTRSSVTVVRPAASAAHSQENIMSEPTTAAAPPALTVESLRANHADLIAAIATAAALAERERITGLLGLALKGHEDLLRGFIADGKTTREQAALALIEAERRVGAAVLDARRADSGSAKVPAAATASEPAAVDPNLPLAERCKAEWDRDPKLRAEFGGNFDAYAAFARADAAGSIRRISRPAA